MDAGYTYSAPISGNSESWQENEDPKAFFFFSLFVVRVAIKKGSSQDRAGGHLYIRGIQRPVPRSDLATSFKRVTTRMRVTTSAGCVPYLAMCINAKRKTNI